MRAFLLDRPYSFVEVDVAPPTADSVPPGCAMIKTLAGGVCGSDLPIFRGAAQSDIAMSEQERFASPMPGFPMHEVVGTVIESRCELEIGQRIVGWSYERGALAEISLVEEHSVVVVDDSTDPVQQIIVQPLACVLHALDQVGSIAGRRCAVLGQGPIGVLFSDVLHDVGAAHVTGVDRIDRTCPDHRFGVDEFVHDSTERWTQSLTEPLRYDLVVEAIGHHNGPINDAIRACSIGGTVYAFGLFDEPAHTIEMRLLQRRQLTIVAGTTLPRHRPRALLRAVAYADTHPTMVGAYVTHAFDVDQVQHAHEVADAPRSGQQKVVIRWP